MSYICQSAGLERMAQFRASLLVNRASWEDQEITLPRMHAVWSGVAPQKEVRV